MLCALVFITLFQILGYVLFLKGFFPTKAILPGFGVFDVPDSPFTTDTGPHFKKLIIMVVDAMRSDFMFSSQDSSMSFLHSVIRNGHALPFTAYSHPPTVTLPRLKGITTGGTPSFIDAVLNIADDQDKSQGLDKVDSWLYQFKHSSGGRNIHFFGDDTWLKLFPPDKFFARHEGISSFFVSDFTEVDNNVTRHLQNEIADESWDALILHYLGLDHIGHKGGPDSTFMAPKQLEMDHVLERLYTSRVANSEDTLLVLLGDHGMNDVGNHGGASAGETSPGLVLMSPKFSRIPAYRDAPLKRSNDFSYYSSISQIDLVPTLAALFDFPIPKNSLGIIFPEILNLWSDETSRKRVLMENCKQFVQILAEKFGNSGISLDKIYQEFTDLAALDKTVDSFYSFMRVAQDTLVKESTNYAYFDIICGLAVILSSTILIWASCFGSFIFGASKNNGGALLLFLSFCFMYALHFHGSSLIEEEHQVWWFLTVTVCVSHYVLSKFKNSISFVFTLILLRAIRGWSDTGQKYFTDITISGYLSSNSELAWLLVSITYISSMMQIFFSVRQVKYSRSTSRFKTLAVFLNLSTFIYPVIISILSFTFKLEQYGLDGNKIPHWLEQFHFGLRRFIGFFLANLEEDFQSANAHISRIFFASSFLFLFSHGLVCKINGNGLAFGKFVSRLIALILIHQSRIEVIPIFMIFTLLKFAYSKLLAGTNTCGLKLKIVLYTIFVLCIQNLSFFSIGNTNSLSTIDLSNAYNGTSEYSIVLVGILTFVSNFAVVIYWSLSASEILMNGLVGYGEIIDIRSVSILRASLNSAFYATSSLSLVSSCLNLRYHLFIWSVFSPKLLYFGAWLLLVNFVVDCFLSSCILTIYE